jgi:hypothetical protein
MEDKWSIKKVPGSQGDVHEKGANQSNSELPSSSPTRSIGSPRIQINVQIAYDLRFRHSTYARKAKEINFLMELVSYLTKIGDVHNHQNSTDFQNHFWCCATIFGHNPRPFIFSSRYHFTWVFLRLICQEQFHRHSVCKTPTFMS